jgi:phosphoribosylaminoimidazolecarboxamide formyltransferase / IMP cyclohydrolase
MTTEQTVIEEGRGPRAILSVENKDGIAGFAEGLHRRGFELFSTGNTHRAIALQTPVKQIADLTGFPEILGGRVKTLHPAVHGGILAKRDDAEHMQEMAQHGLRPIDLVCCNLYPFVETVRSGANLDTALEKIDIGGVTLLRAAAKNFPHVLVVVDPNDYERVLQLLDAGVVPLEDRRALAQKAFAHTAAYDAAISAYLRGDDALPDNLALAFEKISDLRYGENPTQEAAFYAERSINPALSAGIAAAKQLHGKELSFNNILDADAAWQAVRTYPQQCVAIVKHTNPCGLATHDDQAEAYRRAFAGDPVSAYGGIVALNRPLDAATAKEMAPTFYEIVIAPSYSEEALALLRKKRDLRILETGEDRGPLGLDYRRVSGGLLVQTPDDTPTDDEEFSTISQRPPTAEEEENLRFAWHAVRFVKSNAIVLVKELAITGIGAGQPNRVNSVQLAVRAAGDRARGSVMASDAFFPFADGPQLAIDAGVTAIVHPGGSIRDAETLAACDVANVALVVTGIRHFRH